MPKRPRPLPERPSLIDQTLDRAVLAFQAQRPDEAARIAAEVLRSARGNLRAAQLLGQALLMQARPLEAVEVLGPVARRSGDPGIETLLARALAEAGRGAEAQDLLRKATTRRPAYPLAFVELGDRLGKAGRFDEAAAVFEAGLALAPEAQVLRVALGYLRLLIRLDPQKDAAWVMVGDLMQGSGDIEAARQAYAHPRPGSAEFSVAQAKLAWTYQGADDKGTALKLARAAAASGDTDARVTLADLLRSDEQFAEAVQVLDGVIAQQKTPDWRLLYSRGIAYERLNRWTEGQADLQAALKQRPDEPELLNYLGYSWIDRGEHLAEARAMIEKAVASDPRSGAMVDSLGWAFYRMGDYKKAVEKLEEAVELEAGDPEINNHLGDAYWKVGRKDEALFQWRRVLTLNPDSKIKANAEAKLASGLGPDGPVPKLAGS